MITEEIAPRPPDRKLYQAMDQRERLQRQRKGENIPSLLISRCKWRGRLALARCMHQLAGCKHGIRPGKCE
jgi:hypothetical protein